MKIHTQVLRPLAGLVVAVLSFSAWSQETPPQPADATTDLKKATHLEQVTVTGSRIPRASVEGPAPVTVLPGEGPGRHGVP